MNWITPFAGMFIGWITNVIALEMLFLPKDPMYLLGFRLPFTPGLVPQNKTKIVKTASKNISSIVIDSLANGSKEKAFSLFNKILDKYWVTSIFVPEFKRQDIYDKMVTSVAQDKDTQKVIHSILQDQMEEYDANHFEDTVRKLAKESLRGIKVLGGIVGGLVGILTMYIGAL